MRLLIQRSIRTISKSWAQFSAIILIIAIGSGIFTGLLGTLRILNTFLPAYYQTHQLADAWVVLDGIEPAELTKLQASYPDLTIEGRLSFRSELIVMDQSVYVIFNAPTKINQVQLVAGRNVQASDELLLDQDFADRQGYQLNDTLTFAFEAGPQSFKIVGLFYAPEYAYKSQNYSEAASNKAGVAVIQVTEDALKTILRAQASFIEAMAELEEELNQAQQDIDEAWNTLAQEEQDFLKKRQEVYAELDLKRADLSYQQFKLTQQASDLSAPKQQLEAGLAQLNQAIQSATDQFDAAEAQLQAALVVATDVDDQATIDTLSLELANLDQQRQATLNPLVAQRSSLTSQLNQLNDGLAQLQDGLSLIDDGLRQMDEAIQAAVDSFNQAELDLQAAKDKLIDGQKTLDEERFEALRTIEAKLDERYELLILGDDVSGLRQSLESRDDFELYLSRDEFPGYTMIDNILAPIAIMAQIFPLLFFIVSAILILITMSKHVDQDRTQIAILKALGVSTQPILMSYIFYGWVAAISGSLVFGFLGNLYIPYVLLGIFDTRFSLPTIPIPVYLDLQIYALGASLLFASIAIGLALMRVLRENPAQGMRPRPPKKAKTILIEQLRWLWTRLSYAQKLMVRNLALGRLKLLFSSIGIVGSITLLITGLSLQNSADLMVNNAINGYKFDAIVQFEDHQANLDAPWLDQLDAAEWRQGGTLTLGDERLPFLALEIDQDLSKLISVDGQSIQLKPDTVIIPHSMALTQGLSIGDVLSVKVDQQSHSLVITHISNQYLGRTLTFSFETLKRLGIERENTRLAIRHTDGLSADLLQTIRRDEAVKAVDLVGSMRAQSEEIMAMLDQIILIILISSLALTLSVIYNLSSINILERERELATLRVLGYTHSEVKRLIYTENYVLLSLGSVLGVPVGILLFQRIANLVSTREFYMLDQIHWPTIALSVGLAWGMTFLINRVLALRIKRIALVEALKAVE